MSKEEIEDGFDDCEASDGRKGGVPMFWKREGKVSQLYSDPNCIDGGIEERPDRIW